MEEDRRMVQKIKLRPYQSAQVAEVRSAMVKHKHVILQSATGSGKTIMFSYLASATVSKGNNVLILSNRCELLTQAGGALENVDVKAEYISPKHRSVPTGKCVVAMAQTLKRRIEQDDWQDYCRSVNLLIIDEAHFGDYDYVFICGLFDKAWMIGATATPIRSGKQVQLGYQYSAISVGVVTKELIRQGFLVPLRYFAVDAPDLSKVEYDHARGDYLPASLAKAFDNRQRYDGLIREWKKYACGKRTLVFCASQAHAIRTCIEFNDSGYRCKYLISGIKDGKDGSELLRTTKHLTGKRGIIIDEFKRGGFDILVNAGILTAGFDFPALECVVLNMATKSLQKYLQCVGRAVRPFAGKTYGLVLDFGGNIKEHGLYEDERSWHLWHEEGGNGVAGSKECDTKRKDNNGKTGCGRLIHVGAKVCPFCGYVFATEKELRDAELVEIVGGVFRYKDMTPSQLLATAELKGYKKAWVFNMLWMGSKDDIGFRRSMKELGYDNKFIYREQMMLKGRKRYAD